MTRRLALVIALILGLAVSAHADPQADRIKGIIKLVESGVSEEVIVKHIAADKFVYDLTSDEILDLRDQGLSDRVIEAMLDTAVEPKDDSQPGESPQDRVYTRDDSTSAPGDSSTGASVNLSAGYFSPWYQYPYAWGAYYDPFPSCYSLFYYPPFFFSASWGWYGNCHYYYPTYWGYNGWHDPYYWRAVAPRSCFVSVPRHPVNGWAAGRGLPHGPIGPGVHSGQVAGRPGHSAAAPRLSHAWDRDRIYVRRSHTGQYANGTPRHGSSAVWAPGSGRRLGVPQYAPYAGASHSLHRYLNAPASGASPPRTASPAPQPQHAAPASSPHGFSSAPRSAPASTPHSGFGASMPHHR